MLKHRVIPCLLLRDGGLTKTRKFRSGPYVGDPINAVKIFNDKEVDELIVLDIDATRQGRAPDYAFLGELAGECFMPLCYGGGVTSLGQAERLFSLGIEKVCVQSAAMQDRSFVTGLAEKFGSQSVVVSVDVKRTWWRKLKLYSSRDRRVVPATPEVFLREVVQAGAGEVVLNAVHRDGTLEGPDLAMIRQMVAGCDVPLIAMGGIGSLNDIRAAVEAGASAVAAGAFFVFQGPHRAVLITYPQYGELERLLREVA